MSDLGPAWLRHELPHPIANAWHFATLDIPMDGLAAAAAVEVALRFVSALQVSQRLALGLGLPELVRANFARPSLGSWAKLVQELRDGLDPTRVAVPELATWPPRGEGEARLRTLVERRNALAHAGQMAPAARRDAERALAEDAAEVLATLAWLRRLPLVVLLDTQADSEGAHLGRRQTFRGTTTHPEPETWRWRGTANLRHVYLDTPRGLLDVEPFIQHTRLRDAPAETIVVWAAVGERGDVLVRDDLQKLTAWRPLPAPSAARILPLTWLGRTRRATDATVQGSAAIDPAEPPTFVDRPAPAKARSKARGKRSTTRRKATRRAPRRWVAPVVAGLLLVLVALAFVLGRQSGGDAAGAAVTPGSSALPAPVKRVCAGAPPMAGAWHFDTEILGGKPGFGFGLGVRGHYALELRPARDCVMGGLLDKFGYTQNGQLEEERRQDDIAAVVSPRGESIAFSSRLERAPGDTRTADIAMRLAMRGDRLIGLWRHEGADRRRAGYWGLVVGQRDNARNPSQPELRCFHACVEGCHVDSDPTAVASEACLIGCAPRLDDCR